LKLEFSANLPWLGEEHKRMKASKFTEAQKAFILKRGERNNVSRKTVALERITAHDGLHLLRTPTLSR
tara:strand:- start:2203 stop:2406 length:204 start_codon:yes stop_codon:yes gene_type:complete